MAQIFVTVPDNWPDLVVTSYHRSDGGSHSTYSAIDIAIAGISDKSPGSAYWYYYIQTLIWIWAAQRHGVVRFAVPPTCPHFHIQDKADAYQVGYEFISYSPAQGCYVASASDIKNYSGDQVSKLIQNIRKSSVMQSYLASFLNFYREIGTTLSPHPKYLQVRSAGIIGDQDLQGKLTRVFGNGSYATRIADKAARIVGYINADEVPNPLVLFGLAGGAYLLYQIAKEARYWHANKPTN